VSPLSYDFHGLHLSVEVEDDGVRSAVADRLRYFSADALSPPDISFDLRMVSRASEHLVERPSGSGRPVYDWEVGEVSYFDEPDLLYMTVADQARMLVSGQSGNAVASAIHDSPARAYLLSRPLMTLPLVELLKRRGLFSLHAAGLSLDGQALLLAGPSGSGKSTLAIALARAGLDFMSDDMVFIATEGGRVHAFPDEADVSDRTAAWFPELEALRGRPRGGWPKHRVRVEEVFGAAVAPSATPAALVFPTIGDGPQSVIAPMPAAEALVELAPNVLLTDPVPAQRHLDALASLARDIPCYRLWTGRDFSQTASDLRRLVSK
jgi:hypothetical protein